MKEDKRLHFIYRFLFNTGKTLSFDIELDAETLEIIPKNSFQPSRLSQLDFHQCANCPLTKEEHPLCPVTRNLEYILKDFKDIISYEKVTVLVETEERTYSSRTSVQQGLGSMMGIFMVSSGCPILAKLKPMVRFHLPFATLTETIFRAASTYLLGEFIKYKKGQPADWDMDGLIEIYREIEEVNAGLASRFRAITGRDAHLNALIALDVFAKELPQTIKESLRDFEYLYQ
ncbi:DUF6901 family protein [Caldithrix abyssi]